MTLAPSRMPLEEPSKERLRLWLRMLKSTRSIEGKLRESFRDEFETTLPRFDVMAALSRFEDGLKMTLDCDSDTEADLRSLLEEGAKDGIVKFGLHTQSEAMLTCIVPSIMQDNHVHFVDGASGGYTAASRFLKT